MKKIIVVHPGRQHSFQLANALTKSEMLYKYITTIYNKDSSLLMKFALMFLPKQHKQRAIARKSAALNDKDVLLFCEFEAFLLLLIAQIDINKKIYIWAEKRISMRFQKKVANYVIKNNIDVVISYDTNSKILFDILKSKVPAVVRIIDHAHPARNYLYEIYQEYIEKSGDFVKTFEACGYLLNKNYSMTFGKEINDANFHIVASNFSKKGVLFNGISENKIFLVPYGVNLDKFKFNDNKDCNKLRVLFVGEINQRKGIYQILETAKELNTLDIQFDIIGRGSKYCAELYKPYQKYVNFWGHVSFEVLLDFFFHSHVFVFPTLGEGFGLVILEALSAGLPVITTPNCAGADVINDGYNGFIINPCDHLTLKEKILWFKNNPGFLRNMSDNAIKSVQNFTWEHYYERIADAVKQMIKE